CSAVNSQTRTPAENCDAWTSDSSPSPLSSISSSHPENEERLAGQSLIPGVALLDEDQMSTTTSLSVTTWAANGGRPGTSHLMIDGGMNLDSGSNGSQVNNVGVDFVREVSVKTSAFSAEYGRNSGAAVNAVTKSGGNRF